MPSLRTLGRRMIYLLIGLMGILAALMGWLMLSGEIISLSETTFYPGFLRLRYRQGRLLLFVS